ncbi:ESPR-type extended signal peptide-containing protein [Serratia sp. DD3]|uniref:ESPR-type extended signal peptide-containing protein n=1 Tax=Serratia sp. DD3 TaxID=1410619 RepID=UPI0003C52D2D|nr:ESPR-type extended signal peptide-containing protein [Serratia sp. DD3]KEY60805.1 type V secretory pathway, adhesin AidA [Serratia sp. DD3]
MNSKFFKSVWNASLGNYVAVAEYAKNRAAGQSVSIKTPTPSVTDSSTPICRLSRLSQALLGCFSLTLVGVSTASYAACSITPGGSVTMDVPGGTCTVPDGSYTGSTYVFETTAGTIENSGDITLLSSANNTAEFVRAFNTGAQVLLNNLTISPFASSGAGSYGLHTGGTGTGGNIAISGLYTFVGSGTVWGAAAGNLGTAGTITLNNVDINITGGNGGAGLITSTNASNVLTVNGSLLLRNAATNSQGISVGSNATFNLHGSGAATNNITLTGSGSTGMLLGSNSTLDVTNLVSVIGTTAASTRGLTANGAGGQALLHGGLTAAVRSHAITAASGGHATISGLTTVSTTENNAYGAYATGGGHQSPLPMPISPPVVGVAMGFMLQMVR